MITQQAQVKLTLPLELMDYLESKARKFGLPIAAYVRHLVIKDVENMDYPEYQMSDRSLARLNQALADRKAGKAIRVNDITQITSLTQTQRKPKK
jgi:predicted DNA-binding protein